jgi:hypothetical protein
MRSCGVEIENSQFLKIIKIFKKKSRISKKNSKYLNFLTISGGTFGSMSRHLLKSGHVPFTKGACVKDNFTKFSKKITNKIFIFYV